MGAAGEEREGVDGGSLERGAALVFRDGEGAARGQSGGGGKPGIY